jgi:hypothetical protein
MNTPIRAETIIDIKALLLSEYTVFLVKNIYNVLRRIFFIKIFPITSRPNITRKNLCGRARERVYMCVRLRAQSRGFVPIIPAESEEVRHEIVERYGDQESSRLPSYV